MRRIVLLLLVAIGLGRMERTSLSSAHLASGHPLDFSVEGGSIASDAAKDLVGFSNDPGASFSGDRTDVVGFLVFQLPSPAAGELPVVEHASLSVHLADVMGTPQFGLDLYGLPRARTAAELHMFHPDAPYDPSPELYSGPASHSSNTPGDLIHEGFVAPTARSPSWVTTTDVALAEYLSTMYAEGGAGKYVLFRLSPNVTQPPLSSVRIAYLLDFAGIVSMDDPTVADVWNEQDLLPRLEVTFVPEPQVALLAGVLGLGILSPRRNRLKR